MSQNRAAVHQVLRTDGTDTVQQQPTREHSRTQNLSDTQTKPPNAPSGDGFKNFIAVTATVVLGPFEAGLAIQLISGYLAQRVLFGSEMAAIVVLNLVSL